MNADRFTIKSQEALQAAIDLAAARKHSQVTPEHLLAVLLEQSDGMTLPVLRKLGASPDAIRSQVNATLDELPTLSTADEPTTAPELLQIIRAAEHEMRELGDEYVSTEHLLLSLADSSPPTRAGGALRAHGVTKDALVKALAEVRGSHRVTDQSPEDKVQALEKFGIDLTQRAEQGLLDPVIGRDDEIRRVIQVLSRRTKNNPVLIGEPGVGKTAIVEGLAQRIVSGDVPESLRDRRVIALDIGALLASSRGASRPSWPRSRTPAATSSCSWMSCTRSWAPAPPRAPSTRRTCSSRCSRAASCARSARRRSTSTESTSRRTPRSSAASSR
jgi:ATP-dependent Clp protease ATP-binding subunit ClpB